MSLLVPLHFELLAEGWGELVPLLIFVGISVISGIAKATSKRSKSEKQDESTQKLIEMAKRYKAMKDTGRQPNTPAEKLPNARVGTENARNQTMLSEWDRRLQQKKQQTQQRRQQQPYKPQYAPQVSKVDKVQTPQEIPVAYTVPESDTVRRTSTRSNLPQISQKRPPVRATQKRVRRHAKAIPTAQPVREAKTVPKRTKPVIQQVIKPGVSFRSLIKQKNSLRTAILLKEILDKPVGLRDF